MVGNVLKSCQFYGYAVIQILIEPRRFFTELPNNTTGVKSLGFCMICSIFFAMANLFTGNYPSPVKMGSIFFFSSVGMVFISAGLSYMIMVMTIGKKSRFEVLFGVYAFSSGMVLLVSWMSFFLWFTEPWKWWLVYTGLKNTSRLAFKPAVLILLLTIMVQFLLLYSLYLAFLK
ncbi:MAG: hypothetical protein KKE44_26000 [Proteobacteria bacterium]|nr:hypothetical protein [Pseudomonadota bacterium]MBU1586185.1 hypothetical protein [Pseudomonadota bacterium]MBU2627925.1 hypothetical protein [Pseudomonadota bacterium]